MGEGGEKKMVQSMWLVSCYSRDRQLKYVELRVGETKQEAEGRSEDAHGTLYEEYVAIEVDLDNVDGYSIVIK